MILTNPPRIVLDLLNDMPVAEAKPAPSSSPAPSASEDGGADDDFDAVVATIETEPAAFAGSMPVARS